MAKRKKTTRARTRSRTRAVTKSVAPGVPTITPEEWEKELVGSARAASATASSVGGGALFIQTRGGNLSFQNEPLEQPLVAFVLDQIRENNYYEGDFDPEAPRAPSCFSIGRDEAELAPPPDLDTRQSDKCAGCPQNRFGSADRGRGKACKNIVRLALLPYEPDPVKLAKVDHALIRVPTTSVKNFGKYAQKIERGLGRPLWSVVTDITTKDDKKTVWQMLFDLRSSDVDARAGAILLQRRKDALEDLERPPTPGEVDDAPTASPRKRRRKVVRKRGKR